MNETLAGCAALADGEKKGLLDEDK